MCEKTNKTEFIEVFFVPLHGVINVMKDGKKENFVY